MTQPGNPGEVASEFALGAPAGYDQQTYGQPGQYGELAYGQPGQYGRPGQYGQPGKFVSARQVASQTVEPPAVERPQIGRRRPPPPWYAKLFLPDLTTAQQEACAEAVKLLLEGELKSLATKLAVTNERLHDQYDRLNSEASLRFSTAPPLLALCLIAGWLFSYWCLLGVVLAGFLALQGFQRSRAANDLLIQAVVSQVITSTRVSAAAKGIADRDKTSTQKPKKR